MIKFIRQHDTADCGPTCLRIVVKYYNRDISIEKIRNLCQSERDGTSILGISSAAEKIGFSVCAAKLNLKKLTTINLPAIIHWKNNHYVVLYKIKKNRFYIADPAEGKLLFKTSEFLKNWIISDQESAGIALILKITDQFNIETDNSIKSNKNWATFFRYLKPYNFLVSQVLFGLILTAMIQTIPPFLSQSIVDKGINQKNLDFINLILIAQLALMIGKYSIDFIRSWIILYISSRVSIRLLTEFVAKILRLPLQFFNLKQTGDIIQRINDQTRIESFLTNTFLITLFSIVNLIVFSLLLAYYSISIFIIFIFSTSIGLAWMYFFLGQRRTLDQKMFLQTSASHNEISQIVNGIQDIKINNYELNKRWHWESLQVNLSKLRAKFLALNQYQAGGNTFINEAKNVVIIFFSAKAVITGHMSLGGMIAVQYIIGQLNNPIDSLSPFFQGLQDVKISIDRNNDIQEIRDENDTENGVDHRPMVQENIVFHNVSFKYPGYHNSYILNAINFQVPEGKTTAIVGSSGSGKTTLLKLLLKFYDTDSGEITVGHQDIRNIDTKLWRRACGTVLQDGFIFNDTIARNIALSDNDINQDRLNQSLIVANLSDFINTLPLGTKTRIGSTGNSLSQGQKQRLLIARAVYKNPDYIFLDEATNALDATNEKKIIENLNKFFRGKTVLIVAHRLSTVKNADNIIVLDNGRVVEQGNHESLILNKNVYYKLIKNQLELDK